MSAPPEATQVPGWLEPLATRARDVRPDEITRYLAPTPDARPAAVLMLFGYGPDGPDVLLIQRSADLSNHAGQPAFPGGATDPEDDSPVATALREACEEVGLDPDGVEIVATLPPIFLPPSRFVVTPVLAWWREVSEVTAVDPAETASVVRVAVRELADPANRLMYRYPRSGFVGPAFRVGGLFVWGFTAGLLDTLLRLGGWEIPWGPDEQAMPVSSGGRADPEELVLADSELGRPAPGGPAGTTGTTGPADRNRGAGSAPGPAREDTVGAAGGGEEGGDR